MCNLSWTPYSNLEKDNSLKSTPVLAQRWAVWSILTIELRTPMVIESKCMFLSQIQKELCHFNDFTKSRWPYWNCVLEIDRGPGSSSTSGYADGHRIQMYVSITNTEGVMVAAAILDLKKSTGRNVSHPPENVVSDHYELISIDRKSLYNNST